ncbi:hypothetical protein AB3N62_10910 [Leptospira sp. WS4.C2]
MKNKDFETFRSKRIGLNSEILFDSIEENCKQEISDIFKTTFPNLTNLITSARILNLTNRNENYRLYSWTNYNDKSFGWLTKIEFLNCRNHLFIEEHDLILKTIGGIIETYNDPEPSLSNNQNFLFLESECKVGIKNWEEYYKESIIDQNITEIEYNNLIAFTEEANGNLTLYDIKKKNILLFAPDHCFENVTKIFNQPDYTFYKFNSINSFIDYVETLALEWIYKIKK